MADEIKMKGGIIMRPTGKPNRYNVFVGGAYLGDAIRFREDSGPDSWRLFYRELVPGDGARSMSRDFSGSIGGELERFLTTGEGGW